jgi:hypothetical protein
MLVNGRFKRDVCFPRILRVDGSVGCRKRSVISICLTPSAICALLIVCFFSSIWLKMLSCPGGNLRPAYQSPLVYGDLAALIRWMSSGEDVTSVFGPMRATDPVKQFQPHV